MRAIAHDHEWKVPWPELRFCVKCGFINLAESIENGITKWVTCLERPAARYEPLPPDRQTPLLEVRRTVSYAREGDRGQRDSLGLWTWVREPLPFGPVVRSSHGYDKYFPYPGELDGLP